MSGTLVVAEHLAGRLRDVTRELLTAAQDLPRPLAVAVIAATPRLLADGVDLAGVDDVIEVTAGGDEFENDVFADALEALIAARQPEVVVLGFTVNSMGFAPAVAAKLGLGFASDVFGFSIEDGGRVIARRCFYGAKVHAEVELPSGVPALLLLRPTVWAQAEGSGGASRSHLTVEARAPRARHVRFVEAPVADVDITDADFLLSIGRGIGDRENIERFERLAEKMGATLSVSRPIVDSGWMPPARQVGQSGKTVKPKVYLAFGISGAVQHLAGMKASGTIIAVNTDPEAAIFGVAHFGAVVDLFDVADELEKLY
jgi:electron transfer flavoprotein alpha subunit